MVGIVMLAALAAAQAHSPDPQQGPSDIVVEGVREQKERVRQFIRSLDDVRTFGQIGRFHTPVCPVVMGFPEAQNRLIAERMKRVASAAGIQTAGSNCAPNVFLIASVGKGGTIKALAKRFPAYFRDMRDREVRKLAASGDPSVAWQVKGLLSADGTTLKRPRWMDHISTRAPTADRGYGPEPCPSSSPRWWSWSAAH